MLEKAVSLRPFIGAKKFKISRNFYVDLGFEETVLSSNMSVFKTGKLAFYLQDAYVKNWVDNTMLFLEVDDVESFCRQLEALNLTEKYRDENVRLSPVKNFEWGKECYLHDPSGILWHIGEFSK